MYLLASLSATSVFLDLRERYSLKVSVCSLVLFEPEPLVAISGSSLNNGYGMVSRSLRSRFVDLRNYKLIFLFFIKL